MKTSLKVLSWVEIVLGALSLFSWLMVEADPYAFLGGALFVACGWVALSYMKSKGE